MACGPVGGSANHLGHVVPPHFFPGRADCRQDGRQKKQDGFKAHLEKILVDVIFYFQYPRQIQQFGAHGVRATPSGQAPLLFHALDAQLDLSNQTPSLG